MDLVADMLVEYLQKDHSHSIAATRICLPMRRRFARGQSLTGGRFAADRYLNRFWDYPRWVERKRGEFDLFHIVDHTYAHLVHKLRSERTIITCHDLDAFRCVLNGWQDRPSLVLKAIAKHVLRGFRKADRITCNSSATRNEVLAHGLFPPERITVIQNGVHPTCSPVPDPAADAEVEGLLGPAGESPIEILHVGSTVARKRIDVLLSVFAAVRGEFPGARLIRVGGRFTRAQMEQVEEFRLNDAVVVLPFLDWAILPSVYRRASVVLQPSEREGFGLPVIEAMACGTPVVASDLPVLREVGGEAAIYCPVGDVPAWAGSVIRLLRERLERPDRWFGRRAGGIAQAAKFTWAEYAKKTVAVYRDVLDS